MTRFERRVWVVRSLAAAVGLSGLLACSLAIRDRVPAPLPTPSQERATLTLESPPAKDSLIRIVIDNNLFEPARQPAAFRFGDSPPSATPDPVQAAPEPDLVPAEPAPAVVLKGILEGDSPMAILAVGSDTNGRLVGATGNVGELRVLDVGRNGVRLQWGDSIWTLRPGGTP